MIPSLVWLDDATATDAALVGPKAARLAEARQAGLPVPPAFVLTTHAFRRDLDDDVQRLVRQALQRLRKELPNGWPLRLAVRSSAVAEDLGDASFAGVQATVLDVADEDALFAAIREVWASLDGAQAQSYRARHGLTADSTGVLVQAQVPAQSAGIAFSCDPLSGEETTIVEAVRGLGEALASGQAEPQQWRFSPRGDLLTAPRNPLLPARQLQAMRTLLDVAMVHFGGALDIEWADDGQQLWLLQARPITTQPSSWFTNHRPGDQHLWTAGFLNERFTQPVSPLGWSLIEGAMATLALGQPLALTGVRTPPQPLLKLWNGHPYSRVLAWQQLYKLFPDWLLPEDATRFFPEGDTSLRRAPAQPTWGPHLLVNGLRILWRDGRAASPLHNPRAWQRYESRQAAALIQLRFRLRHLNDEADPTAAAGALLRDSQALAEALLLLHRWSIFYADMSYSLLRRLLVARFGLEEGTSRAAAYAAGVETVTTRMNRELETVAAAVATQPAESIGALAPPLRQPVERFLRDFGHRAFSLDLFDPPWEADPDSFLRFLRSVSTRAEAHHDAPPVPPWLRPLLGLTRDYLRLREAQRFHWQQILAFQRRVVLTLAGRWVAEGRLPNAEAVFGLTWTELMDGEPEGAVAAARLAELRTLRAQALQSAGWHYPDFLRGTTPLRPHDKGDLLEGRAVSHGIARGPARLIAHPEALSRLRVGDILVTSSADPAWTPVFGTVAGLVTERGGQLSHGAVVAREYGLPAVFGVAGALRTLKEGETIVVDGTQGVVLRDGANRQG